jgi:uncharacterized protein
MMNGSCLLLTALALSVADVPDPRDQGSWVADTAEVLTPRAEISLDRIAGDLNRDLGTEAAVVTVRGVDGDPKDFATALFAEWGIGSAHADNGILVLLIVDPGRIEIEPGYGLEAVLTDGWLGTMQAETMVPHLERAEFGKGLAAGLEAIDDRLRSRPTEASEEPRHPPPSTPVETSRFKGGLWIGGVLAIALVGALAATAFLRRR